MDERFKRSEFAIRLGSVDDLFESFDARPIANRPLNYEARMSLLDQWELSRDAEPSRVASRPLGGSSTANKA